MTTTPEELPTPEQAYRRARELEMKQHTYNYIDSQSPNALAKCRCGVQTDANEIALHIEKAAELSGLAAADDARRAIRLAGGVPS